MGDRTTVEITVRRADLDRLVAEKYQGNVDALLLEVGAERYDGNVFLYQFSSFGNGGNASSLRN